MLILAAFVLLAQPADYLQSRIAAGRGTGFIVYLGTCTEKQAARIENVPGNVGWTMHRCMAGTWTDTHKQSDHAHAVRMLAMDPNGKMTCEVKTTIQPHTPPRIVAAVEALYSLQAPPTPGVIPGAYKIQVCKTEIVPPGGKPEEPPGESCSAFGTLRVRPDAELVRCTLATH